MKTDELIRALAADLPTRQISINDAAMRVLPVAIVVSAGTFLLFLGIRPALSSQWTLVVPKLLVTGALAISAMFVCMSVARPEKAPWSVFAILCLPIVIMTGLVLSDLQRFGVLGWQTRALGSSGLYCLSMIPLLSLAPLAAILFAARCGAVTRHYLAGGIAGLAASGIGASLYALHCTDDSPLFVALWYSLASLVMAALGAIACRLTVRW